MKRSDALAPLSRDHHQALSVAMGLRRATEDDVRAAVERYTSFLDRHERRHFDVEEALILPALPESDAEWAEGCARVRADHERLRGGLRADASVEEAREVGELLAAHVRFEERELFELLESRLDDGALARLGAAIEEAEARA